MLAINGSLLAVLIPVLIGLIIGVTSKSLIMGGMGGILSLSFVAAKVANNFTSSAFILVAFFASMGAAVFMARTVLGEE